ncbi:MAG: hypothetical protein ACLR9W_00335 [Enterobacter hormaechei]
MATHFAIRLVTRASVRGIDNHRGAGLAVGFCASVLIQRREPQKIHAYVIPATGLLSLIFLALLHTPCWIRGE